MVTWQAVGGRWPLDLCKEDVYASGTRVFGIFPCVEVFSQLAYIEEIRMNRCILILILLPFLNISQAVAQEENCIEVTNSASGNSLWSNGLSTDLDMEILNRDIVKYKIQWFNGRWSGWYFPGNGDIDWKDDGRRVWAYFADHTHTYCYVPPAECGIQTLQLGNPFPNPTDDHSTVKRRATLIVLDKNIQTYPATIVSKTYDGNGRLVSTETGEYQSGFDIDIVVWQVGNVASGTYTIKTRIEDSLCGPTQWDSKKVIILN